MQTINRIIQRFAEFPRFARATMVAFADIMVCIATAWLAFWLRLGEWYAFEPNVLIFQAIAVAVWLAVALPSRIYRSLVRFSGRETVTQLIRSCVVMSILLGIVLLALRVQGIPRTLAVLHPFVFLAGLAATRLTLGSLLIQALYFNPSRAKRKRVLIYGAGSAGQQLAVSIRQDPQFRIVGFVDDNAVLSGRSLEGKPIWPSEDLEKILAMEDIEEVFLALSSMSRAGRRSIVERLRQSAPRVRVRTLPSISEIAFDRVSINDLREVQIEELLGRDEVAPVGALMAKQIAGKCVMVTGAGGSIGSELCRQILREHPSSLILVEHSEHALYAIDAELRELAQRDGGRVAIVSELADVGRASECNRVFESWKPHTVFHAAAYKHVPLVEANPLPGIRNNVVGTLNSCMAAEAVGTRSFILVSTDKAVRPSSVMGASKRVCELIVQGRSAVQDDTVYSAVRFGNVLGSSGSVVPLFRSQIERGGPVTITHPLVTRFFMTISEASQLVIQAGAMAEGGEVFLLDMGEPVLIYDLARTMIELSGLTVRDESNPAGDIDIVETGLRPGEKLHEELLIEESALPTGHPRIVKARESMIDWIHLERRLDDLQQSIEDGDSSAAMELLRLLVPSFGNGDREEFRPLSISELLSRRLSTVN